MDNNSNEKNNDNSNNKSENNENETKERSIISTKEETKEIRDVEIIFNKNKIKIIFI